MHGERGQGHPESDDRLRRSTNRHMCTRAAKSVASAGGSHLPSSPSPSFILANSFFKDGRKISVGDCALFKPPQGSPPFIGIICWLTAGKDTKLGVNWLYRPSEVKLGKGIQLEAAPNEVFYSFHKDEILSASLLHPCKVAFLPKGVELPPGVSSFVCRRVFDIANKCLWWLTDRDFIDDRQQEVDQLLYKTRVEMHAAMQPGGRSPKPINGPTTTSQLKSSDGIPNVSSFPAVKGKKRERGDQGSEPMKRASKMDDGDSGQLRLENNLKTEISKITDRGGLVDSEGVEKLVELMSPEKVEKKIDLFGRSLLAGVIAATDKFDCLSQFVQLKGLTVFDDWLQEFHKGKIGNVNSHKEGDKSVEEFLLVLLRALDKLPVNLNALQKCNIGKSVNHLRSHKNLEIQKKARSLVDTWKKRVEAEMNINDAKSGSNQAVSWPGRARVSDGSHGGNRHSGASEMAVKSTITQLTASRTVSIKPAQGDVIAKSASVSPSLGSTKSALSPTTNLKDAQLKSAVGGGSSDIAPAREEKSSSSSQSHNSQSCSSDLVKNVVSSAKDDARSSTAGSMSVSKLSAGASRSKKSFSALPGPASNAVQRESVSSRSPSVNRNTASEKLPQSSEKALDTPTADSNSHKLIVKIPNRGRSPAQSVSGGSFDEPSLMSSRASSPARPEKQEQCDHLTGKSDPCRANFVSDVKSESWQSNDFKDVLTGSEEGDGSPAAVPDEERCGTGEDSKKMAETTKAASSSSGNELKLGKMHEVSYSSMEALVASCVKHSETNSSVPIADDGGMNLLASVATDSTLHTTYPQKSPAVEDIFPVNHSNLSKGSDIPGEPTHTNVRPADDENIVKQVVLSQEKEVIKPDDKSSTRNVQETADQMECIEKVDETAAAASDVAPSMDEVGKGSEGVGDAPEQSKAVVRLNADGVSDKIKAIHVLEKEGSINEKTDRNAAEGLTSDSRKEADDGLLIHSGSGEEDRSENQKDCDIKEMDTSCHTEKHRFELKTSSLPMNKDQAIAGGLGSSAADSKKGFLEENLETDEAPERCSVSPYKGPQQYPGEDKSDECTSTAADAASTAAGHDADEKLEFDLNEGLSADEGKYGEANSMTPCSATAHLVNPLSFPFSSVSSSIPSSVTVTAAAKGPFVPPDNLLKNKGELGWKGSASTSAFRPAEPRKILDFPINGTNASLSDGSSSKKGRPLLDIDLNVPDERILEDMAASQNGVGAIDHDAMRHKSMSAGPARSSGGLDLDLNRADEVPDLGPYFAGSNFKLDPRLMPEKVSSPRICPNREPSVQRDFDLNDGPVVDEVHSEQSQLGQQACSSFPFHAPGTGLRMKNTNISNFSSWFPPVNPYSQVAIPPVFSDRGEQPFSLAAPGGSQRVLSGPTSVSPFNADVYRGPVLSSSPAVPFPSAPFQYPVFSFGTNFPLPSAALTGATNYMDTSSSGRHYFSAVNSQLVGPAGAVASFQRPYVVSIPDGGADTGFDANRRWGRQGLDLNAGPGGLEIEGRDLVSLFTSRQPSVPNSQVTMEEQGRIYHASGGVKRKEPEGGWEAEKYKQSSWH